MDKDLLLKEIRKEFGEGSMFILGEDGRLGDIKVRSSGSLLLDLALGGGYPQGRLVELRGTERSGKTTLMCLAIAEAQKTEPNKVCGIIDLEHTFNPAWAELLGVDLSKLFISQPDTYAERIYDMIEFLLRKETFSILGVDSIAGLVPKSEFEEEDWTKESRVGGASKLNSMAMRKLINSGLLSASGTTLIFINQLRDKIGSFSLYGTPTDTPGGRSLKHNCSQQLDVSIGEYFTKGSGSNKEYLGQQIKIKVAKNKIAPPFRLATVDLYYEAGVDRVIELINVAKAINVLSGTSWLKLTNPITGEIILDDEGKEIRFNGVQKAREALLEDIDGEDKVYSKIFNLVQQVLRG